MYESEYLYLLTCRTLILISASCIVYILKSIISGFSKLIKGTTHDIVEVVEKLEEDMKEQQKQIQKEIPNP